MQAACLSDWTERREPRHKVIMHARMRAGGLPVDVFVRDVSAHGLSIRVCSPPPRGTIIELTGLSVPIVGQVVWTGEVSFGVALRGRINVEALLANRGGGALRPPAEPETLRYREPVRAPAMRAEASRHLSNAMQFGVFALLALGAAGSIAETAYTNLSRTFDTVASGMTP